MEISSDFEEFFALLNKHEVRYLAVGGYAFAIHARPRFTDDLDIFLLVEEENANRALQALREFGFADFSCPPLYQHLHKVLHLLPKLGRQLLNQLFDSFHGLTSHFCLS